MQTEDPVCATCQWNLGLRRCMAYDRIPDDIWMEGARHDEPRPDDQGYQYTVRAVEAL